MNIVVNKNRKWMLTVAEWRDILVEKTKKFCPKINFHRPEITQAYLTKQLLPACVAAFTFYAIRKVLKLALLTLTALSDETKYFTQWNNFEKFSCNICQGWDQHLSQEEIGWSSDRSNKEVIISCFLLAKQYFLPQIALSSRWLKQSVSDLLSSSFGS